MPASMPCVWSCPMDRTRPASLAAALARLILNAVWRVRGHDVACCSPRRPGVDVTRFLAEQFTEATLVDYVRSQLNEIPKPNPETVNIRSSMLRRLFRFHFQQDLPHAPYLIH